ncbi:Homeodomain-like protein [Artemisia annua]|uniref:Homeodomain-like protein n=1 Tax=Artemisia annua TaxID=35608 RepID=A0A2U1QEB7_ARTAN|nr:Homeodomain-like protein [Artemisia annua]
MCSRGHWRPSEDQKLRQLVQQYGPHNWNAIAEKLQGRSGKSCRLRWFNQLDPKINRSPFTEEEEERLLAYHREFGNRWANIAKLFPDKRDRSVEFYNFLPVNTDSNSSEVIDHQRKDEVEVEQEATEEQQGSTNTTVPFIDFLSVN